MSQYTLYKIAHTPHLSEKTKAYIAFNVQHHYRTTFEEQNIFPVNRIADVVGADIEPKDLAFIKGLDDEGVDFITF